MAAEDVAEVVGVGAVGEHVGDLELAAAFGVGVAGHDDGDLFAAQIVGPRLALPDALDLPLGVAEADEFLRNSGFGVLDVVEVDHHVVAHLQREVEFLDLLAGGCIRGLGGVERNHAVAERRAVDLHERQAEPVGDVFHDRRLAVAGRRNEEQQAPAVGAGVAADGADLLGEVVADERQIDLVDQPVADEGAHDLRLELIEAHLVATVLDQCAA